MLRKNLASEIKTNIDINSDEFIHNKNVMLKKINFLDELLDKAELGGGAYHHERLAKRGKMPVRERVFNLLDPDTPFLEIAPFAAYGTDFTVGGGCVAGIGIVAGTECVIFANDPSVLAGAMTVYVGEKWNRAMEIARDNRLPYINFVESAGGDLRMGTGKKGDQPPIAPTIGHTHFAASGRYFYDLTELSKMRIPVISIVFGSSTAGGAYQPGMSDYNIFVKDQAKVFLAGPPLVKMATGEVSDDVALHQSTQTIINEVQHLKRMVSEFSNFAKIPESNPQINDLNQIIINAQHLFHENLPTRISLNTDLSDSLPQLPLDSEQIRRVIINLVDNSISSIEKKGTLSRIFNQGKIIIRKQIADSDENNYIEKFDYLLAVSYTHLTLRTNREE